MNARTLKQGQKDKQELIKNTLKALRTLRKGDTKSLMAFAKIFLDQLPVGDVNDLNTEMLAGVVTEMFDFGAKRHPAESLVCVDTLEVDNGEAIGSRTIIKTVNMDMPFLLDSIAAELSKNFYAIETLFHPILSVDRKGSGKFENAKKTAKNSKANESYIYIELETALSVSKSKALEETLKTVVADVKKATQDWPHMLGKMKDVIEAISQNNKDKTSCESKDFLQYIHDNNFTFLGYRQDVVKTIKKEKVFQVKSGSALGLLASKTKMLAAQKEVRLLEKESDVVMVSKLIDETSTVHRAVPLDMVVVKITDKKGKIIGRHVFVGLFTSSTYSCRTSEVPIVRRKVQETVQRAQFGRDSHDHKALEHILEKYPRDELFRIDVDDLVPVVLGILRLQERHRIALFTRSDQIGQYMTALVYVPRDTFDSVFRQELGAILEDNFDATLMGFHTTLDDSPLARILFTLKLKGKNPSARKIQIVEQKMIDAGRGWHDAMKKSFIECEGYQQGLYLFEKYKASFNRSYQEQVDPYNAINDVWKLEAASEKSPIKIEFYKLLKSEKNDFRLKVYHDKRPVPLSDILPILNDMGVRVNAELPFEICPEGMKDPIWIHDFFLEVDVNLKVEDVKDVFEDAFLNVWSKKAESDPLNALILKSGISWRDLNIMRIYLSYLSQARFPYSRRYMESVLIENPEIVDALITLFHLKNDPAGYKRNDDRVSKLETVILKKLNKISKLDHDQILRSFLALVKATLRTNAYQTESCGMPKPWLAVKLDCGVLDFVPKPKPYREIYVYSTRVEALHLRGGAIARGGLRWSDRHDDFRTEILGLVKAQMVKNAVIVPVGAKGGFVVKQPPQTGNRQDYLDEGISCYKILIQALLDITDNNVKGKVIKPVDVVCHDGDDPYLVVAADKGTATFSDIANGLSRDAGFWLDDAFASGGSAGYDHKGMGITAKGGWESVKRHFREINHDIQNKDFTCMGVGDMGGDVFGNGMLLSKHTRLIGAFNHLHIFCDPNPDAKKSFKERQRLFDTRGGWDKYDEKILSKGARIFDRSSKTLKLTKEIQDAFGIDKKQVTPNELMNHMLKMDVDLLWFGGIGTYIKASHESHADADDKGNDLIRVDGRELKAKVIGEGANLGVTQFGRIEYARHGGRLNTDFIDNSAGVDCSDHEVNIKILLSDVMKSSKMTLKKRNVLLEKMTDQVSDLVLMDNYQQSQALSMCQFDAEAEMNRYVSYVQYLDKENILDRKVENLPEDDVLSQMLKENTVFTRPEFSVLLSYSKIQLYKELLKTKIVNESFMTKYLFEYFPKDLLKFEKEILNHKLKSEIVATVLSNMVVNRMGPTFVMSRMEKTGASFEDVARAFIVSVETFGVQKLWDDIESLDNKVDARVQAKALNEVFGLIKRSVTWLLRNGVPKDIGKYIQGLQKGIAEYSSVLSKVLPEHILVEAEKRYHVFVAEGVPKSIAERVSSLRSMISAHDILQIKGTCSSKTKDISDVYYTVGGRLQIDKLREAFGQFETKSHWDARVISALSDQLYITQATITAQITKKIKGSKSKEACVDQWFVKKAETVDILSQLFEEVWASDTQNSAMFVLITQRLSGLLSS